MTLQDGNRLMSTNCDYVNRADLGAFNDYIEPFDHERL